MPYPNRSAGTRILVKDLRSRYKETMAIDYVRGGNPRCPSFLVGGLAILCLFFACSWWSLTSQNFELLNQVNDLEDHLKISGEELDKCVVAKAALNERANSLQNNAAQQSVKLEQLNTAEEELRDTLKKTQDDLTEANQKISSLTSSLKFKSTELESLKKLGEAKNKTLEALRSEKKTLTAKLDEEESKVDTLRQEISSLRKEKAEKPADKVVGMLLDKKPKDDDTSPIGGVAIAGDHAAAAAIDENKAAEVGDVAPEPSLPENQDEPDPREDMMANKGGD